MKRLIIGDIHGSSIINNIYNKENPDEVIVLGNYFDNPNIDPNTQKINFDSLLKLRNNHISSGKGNFILILGNHDFHYLKDSFEIYPGYTDKIAGLVSNLIEDLFVNNVLQISYIDKTNKIIFSNAGISNSWFNKNCKSIEDINKVDIDSLKYNKNINGPLWTTEEVLYNDPYKCDDIIWNQIYGHTYTKYSKRYYIEDEYDFNKDAFFYNLNCLPNEYLIQNLDENKKIKYNDFCLID